MVLARETLEQLAAPLNRGDFPAFVEAVGRLRGADRNILAVLGAGELLGQADAFDYLRSPVDLVACLVQFKKENVGDI